MRRVPCRFQVGDKVVLDKFWLPCDTHLKPRPRHGRVYCVRLVQEDEGGRQFLRLVGLRSLPVKLAGEEVNVSADCFRPVGRVAPAVDP